MKSFRTHFVILMLLCYTSITNAQFSFVNTLRSQDSEVFYDAFEDQEGNYVCIGAKSFQTGNYNSSPIIYKYSYTGELISSQTIVKADTNSGFQFGFQKTNGNFLLIGTLGDTVTPLDNNHIYICEVNHELEINWEKIYQIPQPYNDITNENYFISSDQRIVVQGKADSVLYSFDNHLVLSIFDMEGNMLNFNMPEGWKDYSHRGDMIEKPDGLGFYLICEFNENFSPRDWVEVDYDLNIVDFGYFENSWNAAIAPASIIRLENNNYFMANYSHDNQTGDTGDLLVRIFDQEFTTLSDTIINYEDKMYLPVHNGVDITTENNIWVCVFEALPTNFMGTEDFYVHIFNPEMGLKGTKVYGGDQRYWMNDLTATSDGGCMIVGIVPDFEGSNGVDAYMIKMMPEDVLTGIETLQQSNDESVSISPNPFNDILFVESSEKNVALYLYNSFGQIMLVRKPISSQKITVPTSTLTSGVYLYTIKYENGTSETGKIIKN